MSRGPRDNSKPRRGFRQVKNVYPRALLSARIERELERSRRDARNVRGMLDRTLRDFAFRSGDRARLKIWKWGEVGGISRNWCKHRVIPALFHSLRKLHIPARRYRFYSSFESRSLRPEFSSIGISDRTKGTVSLL